MLFICGLLVFADEQALSIPAFGAVIILLFGIGFEAGRPRAILWAAVLVLSAVVADVLWQLDSDPFDRSHFYEALPATPFVLIGLPVPMAVVAAGVAAGRISRRRTGA